MPDEISDTATAPFNVKRNASRRVMVLGSELEVVSQQLELLHIRNPHAAPVLRDEILAEVVNVLRAVLCHTKFFLATRARSFHDITPLGLSMRPSKYGSPTVVMMPPEKPARSMSKVFAPIGAEESAAAIPAHPPPQTRASV